MGIPYGPMSHARRVDELPMPDEGMEITTDKFYYFGHPSCGWPEEAYRHVKQRGEGKADKRSDVKRKKKSVDRELGENRRKKQ